MQMYKLMFLNTAIMGTLITISSYSWFSMWMGLEINMLSIIPLFSSTKNMFASEAGTKYFMTQALASMLLLLSILMALTKNETIYMMSVEKLILNSALLTKLGSAPFHVWFPEVIEGLSWMNSLLLLTWQKIAPMILIMNTQMENKIIMMAIISSLMVSSIMAFNQISLRKIMAFSSINHIAWMLAATMVSTTMWSYYFTIYSLISLNLILMMNSNKVFLLNQMSNLMEKNKKVKLSFTVNFMSLGGLPPFLGFLPKWLLINLMIEKNMILIALTLIMLTMIMLFIYIQLTLSSIIMGQTELKTYSPLNFNWNSQLLNSITINSLILCISMYNLL
uniref:NADH-ubiquinone oxidoreductase chain 2 n=1 Tax=Tenebrionoidea sp. 14 KM-2017 TaxID=2219469 RepID=A0A346RFN5_9CUCU|nr:NADH dehydrogenase subunit 2 [Tenebrionoidea sp. 14 KM-2017]